VVVLGDLSEDIDLSKWTRERVMINLYIALDGRAREKFRPDVDFA
jgi:hypothetical protein